MAEGGQKKEMVKGAASKVEMVHIVSETEKKCREGTQQIPVFETIDSQTHRKKGSRKTQQGAEETSQTMVTKMPVRAQTAQMKQETVLWDSGSQGLNSKFMFDAMSHRLFMGGKPIVNFYIVITQMHSFCDDKTEQCTRTLIDCKCFVWHGGICTEYSFKKVRMEELANYELLNRMPFAVSFCNNKSELANHLYSYINSLIFEYQGEVVQTFETSGWKRLGNHTNVYVTADGAVGHPEWKILSGDGFSMKDIYSGSLYAEFQNMRQTLSRPEQMDVILLYTLGQTLHTLFDEANVGLKHILFIVGPRGSGKTAVSLCFTQLEHKNSPKYNFQATEAGLQANLMYHKDRVMLIDDLAPSADIGDKKQKEHKLESIIRLFGDGSQRVINTYFMKSNADKIDYSVHGGAVITGEYFYTTGSESSIARAVVIELEKESVNWEWLTYFQQNPQILESLVYRFLDFISKNYGWSLNLIRECVEFYRREMPQRQFSNRRYCDYYGQYMAAGRLLMAFFQGESGIDEQEQQRYLNSLQNGIFNLLIANDQAMRRKAPVNEVIMSIIYFLESGNCGNWGEPFTDDRPLIQHEGMLYFRQKDLPGMKQKYANKVNIPYISMSSTEIGNLLEVHGYCESYMEGKKKRLGKKYSSYGNERIMCIPMQKIYAFQETMPMDY